MLEANAKQHMRKLLNEALDTRIANSLCEYWLQLNGTGFFVLDACSYKNVSNRKVLWEFRFSSLGSLNISGFYLYVPYKVVPYKKVCMLPDRPWIHLPLN